MIRTLLFTVSAYLLALPGLASACDRGLQEWTATNGKVCLSLHVVAILACLDKVSGGQLSVEKDESGSSNSGSHVSVHAGGGTLAARGKASVTVDGTKSNVAIRKLKKTFDSAVAKQCFSIGQVGASRPRAESDAKTAPPRPPAKADAAPAQQKSPGEPILQTAGQQATGWELKFEKVHDFVDVHVGGSGGQLIAWPDRGDGGRHTWSSKDPVNEVRSIQPFVGDGDQIKLYAVCIDAGVTGDHQVDMDTRYSGRRVQRWEFDGNEEHDIRR